MGTKKTAIRDDYNKGTHVSFIPITKGLLFPVTLKHRFERAHICTAGQNKSSKGNVLKIRYCLFRFVDVLATQNSNDCNCLWSAQIQLNAQRQSNLFLSGVLLKPFNQPSTQISQ